MGRSSIETWRSSLEPCFGYYRPTGVLGHVMIERDTKPSRETPMVQSSHQKRKDNPAMT